MCRFRMHLLNAFERGTVKKREREELEKNGIEFDKHVFWCWVFNSFSVSVLFSLFLVILTYLAKYI